MRWNTKGRLKIKFGFQTTFLPYDRAGFGLSCCNIGLLRI
ncbi:hypothetical protein NEIMUCOT_04219 [Neisseria mucosa ATCC 25996]|uniref:Uncharacterized protein n=1 Tax=Neisseria mucosa (strain ATCC 25996 / DSM 4631 / NCTC 10774 / M26) TaxID=546266 RepID=D2ZUD1_NEIM2|nr:hypothetical protein NEIMUCOT_04219 [Neisseria mucosa ATCC 25996]